MKSDDKIRHILWPNKSALWMTIILLVTSVIFSVPTYIAYFKNSIPSNILESFVSAGNTFFLVIILFELLIYADICTRTPESYRDFARNLLISFVRLSVGFAIFLVSLCILSAPISFLSNKWSFQVVKNYAPIPVYLYIFVFMIMGFYTSLKEFRWTWLLPYSHANFAEHFKHIYIGEKQSIWSSILYFSMVILMIVSITSLALRKKKKAIDSLDRVL